MTIASFSNKQKGCSLGVPPFPLHVQTVQYSEQISKNGKTFHYTEQFFDFWKTFSVRVDRDANVLPSGIASYKYAAKAAIFSVEPVEPVEP